MDAGTCNSETERQIRERESSLGLLAKELGPFGLSAIDFFKYLRRKYLLQALPADIRPFLERVLGKPLCEIIGTEIKVENEGLLDAFIAEKGFDWADSNFHLMYRVTSANDLKDTLGINGELSKVILKGYNLSILPLNIVIGNGNLLAKFIPKKDFFSDFYAKKQDPYGIFAKGSKIEKNGNYLASQKFKRTVLMNITGVCPMGCVGCYKGEFTRIVGKSFYTNLALAVDVQAGALVDYLNQHPEIKSVIVSGGEPLLLANDGWNGMLKHFERGKHLCELRICTGAIFQGLPFRIDDELLDLLESFENRTGIKINFNAHLSHPSQFSTEALIAVHKITRRGFPINTQVPLQRNVNVFIEDFGKTMDLLVELAKLQGTSGVRPYKYILHMNCGSLEYSVPLEFMLKILAELKYGIGHPLPETWQPVSCSILCQAGNILLSPQLLFLIKKKVNRHKGCVSYDIPVPIGERKWKVVKYIEPLLAGHNDSASSLNKLHSELYDAFQNKLLEIEA